MKRFSVPGVGGPTASGTGARHLLGGREPRGCLAGGPTFAPGRQEGQPCVPAAGCQAVHLAGARFFVGPLLGILLWRSSFAASSAGSRGAPVSRWQRQGLMAVLRRPQVGGVRRLLVGLCSRPGHTECDVCAGGGRPGGTSDSWALLHGQATCPRALYGDRLSSRRGPRE